MKLIAGLGNPGEEYAQTRHNLGFMVIDSLQLEMGFPRFRNECQSLVSRADWEGIAMGIVKPQTFMNLSGYAVAALTAKYKAPREDLLVVSDDIALPFGKLRLRRKGTHGGHNGLRSIIEQLGHTDFPRLRIGICPADKSISDPARFVLAPFNKAERAALDEVLIRAGQAVESVVRDGIAWAMAKYN